MIIIRSTQSAYDALKNCITDKNDFIRQHPQDYTTHDSVEELGSGWTLLPAIDDLIIYERAV